jgi:rhamnosyltransferase
VKILAVVVLYFPDKSVIQRIDALLQHVSTVLVIDNSEPSPEWLTPELLNKPNIILKINHSNKGIASALNAGATMAINDSFDWLLTMDQDSSFRAHSLEELIAVAASSPTSVALISPHHLTPKGRELQAIDRTTVISFAMTSGNLVRPEAHIKNGPFDERLFIDSVDHDYCLRLRQNGFTILRANKSILEHPLGEIQYHRFLFLKLKTTNHSPLRRYYITRNRLYVMFRFMTFDRHFFFRELRELIKSFLIVIFLDQEKMKKLKWMCRGVLDYMRGRYGKVQS